MRSLPSRFVLSLALVLPACGDSEEGAAGPTTEAERLFAAAASPDANATSVEGIWESTSPRVQASLESTIRLELRADRVVAAARCIQTPGGSTTLIGKEGPAKISATTLEFPEEVRVSEPVGDSICTVVVRAGTLPQCDLTKPVTGRTFCFELAKGTLTIREESAAAQYKKITD